ncbi:MAG: hypothetical protein ACOX3T_05400 [Bdellovibrionota bacterium]
MKKIFTLQFFTLLLALLIAQMLIFANGAMCETKKTQIKIDRKKIQREVLENSYNEIIEDYKNSYNGRKLEKKWEKALYETLKNGNNYAKNFNMKQNVLFHIRSKEKNLDMSYTNKDYVAKADNKEQNTTLSRQELEESSKEMEKSIEKHYTPKRIENCKKSFTETEANALRDRYALREENEVVFDELLLSKDVLKYIKKDKLIEKDFFGDKNKIKFYSNEPFDFVSLKLKDFEVKCLPLRVIVTKNTITRHYGVNALKNYDFKKEDGELHYQVKKNLKKLLLDLD